MTTGKGYAPLGKSKTIPSPDVNRNNKPVKTSGDKNEIKGTRRMLKSKDKTVAWF